jgi:hypothetical protein
MQNGGKTCSMLFFKKYLHLILNQERFENKLSDLFALAKECSIKHIAYDEIFNLEHLATGKIMHTDFQKRSKKFVVVNQRNEVEKSQPLSECEVNKRKLDTRRWVSDVHLMPLIESSERRISENRR